jgi:cobalt transporter subunit CbtB
MNDTLALEPIPLRSLAPWTAIAALLLLQLYLIGLDQGAVSQAGDLLHELAHDGRHLLAFPCH